MRWFRRMPVLHIAEERGEGPTVLLLHGIASSSVTFHHVIPLLERTHRCIAIDLLGFGESPAPEWADYTLADHVAAIERTVASLRLREPFTVVGHSMGALIGARYAARRQKRVAKLVMVSPPIYLAPHEIGDVIERARMDFYLRLYEFLRTNREFTLRHAALVQRLLPIPKAVDITERNWEPFVKSLQHSIESQTTLSDIAHVKAPIDVIMGDLDEFRSEAVLRIVERMRGVTVRRVRATNHLIGKRLARVVAEAVTA
ncbi:alpha/beta hydrolase [Microbacterium sp. 2C]|nr:alpha/beta hydrolase [Microbacterium paulum]